MSKSAIVRLGVVGLVGVLAGTAHGEGASGGAIFDEGSVIVVGTIPDGYARFADLNGDGDQDFILGYRVGYESGSAIFRVAMGTGDGEAGMATVFSIASGNGTMIHDVVPCDLDNDGDMDLVALVGVTVYGKFDAFTSAYLQVYENDGSGSFSELGGLSSVSSDAIFAEYRVAVGDFDGDGMRNDIAVSDAENFRIRVYSWDGAWSWNATLLSGRVRGLVPIDFDGDGDDDLALLYGISDSVSLRQNLGGGSFTEVASLTTGDNPEDMEVGDVDGDMMPDLVVYNSTSGGAEDSITVFLNGGDVFAGVGTAFDVGILGSTSTFVLSRMAVGDVDQDGDVDIVLNRMNGAGDKDLYLNDGAGAFAFAESHSMVGYSVSLVDLNGDGGLDLVASSIAIGIDNFPRVLLNELVGVCAADLTGDGRLDFFDISMFLADMVDFNGDTVFDFFDVSSFLEAFASGCP